MSERKRVIAVVDDDPRVLESLGELFESSGYVVSAYPSAQTLIDAGLSNVDCLISDIGMPAIIRPSFTMGGVGGGYARWGQFLAGGSA